jgi:hypothetical protein
MSKNQPDSGTATSLGAPDAKTTIVGCIPFVMFHFLDSTSRTPGADAANEMMHSRLPVGRALMWSPAKPLAISLNGVPFLDSGSHGGEVGERNG